MIWVNIIPPNAKYKPFLKTGILRKYSRNGENDKKEQRQVKKDVEKLEWTVVVCRSYQVSLGAGLIP